MVGRILGNMVAPPTIRLERLILRHGQRDVIRGLTGQFAPGSLTALIGDNGAGKTTLLRAMTGQHPISGGTIDSGLPTSRIALLAQDSQLDRSFPIGCRDVVALGLSGSLGPFRGIGTAQHRQIDQALAAVGLADLGDRSIGALSAGQFQRVLFARLILQDAPVLLLDEPFSAVDTATAADLLGILHEWHREGRTIVTVLHDHALARTHFPETLRLDGAKTSWGPTGRGPTEWGPTEWGPTEWGPTGWAPRAAA